MDFQTSTTKDSRTVPEVRYTIRRVSFQGRLDLTRLIGERLARLEYLSAGQSAEDRVGAALLSGEVDRLYIEWGLLSLDGLTVDGVRCDTELLIRSGPEALCAEIAAAIKAECTLSADERKN